MVAPVHVLRYGLSGKYRYRCAIHYTGDPKYSMVLVSLATKPPCMELVGIVAVTNGGEEISDAQ